MTASPVNAESGPGWYVDVYGGPVTSEWLRGYLEAHDGRVDYFQVLLAAVTRDQFLLDTSRVTAACLLKHLIYELGGHIALAVDDDGLTGQVFDLEPERWAA